METIATSKGQIVIPSSVRRKFGIQKGTKIKIEVDESNFLIILRLITRESIHKFRGILKVVPGQKSATQQLLDERKEDLQREETKHAKHGTR